MLHRAQEFVQAKRSSRRRKQSSTNEFRSKQRNERETGNTDSNNIFSDSVQRILVLGSNFWRHRLQIYSSQDCMLVYLNADLDMKTDIKRHISWNTERKIWWQPYHGRNSIHDRAICFQLVVGYSYVFLLSALKFISSDLVGFIGFKHKYKLFLVWEVVPLGVF